MISVVIPTRDRCQDLTRALEAWDRQTPEDLRFEVVVVDDGSTDDTVSTLAAWRPGRYSLRWARQEARGPASARNRALALASAPLVLFTGDDIEPSASLLEAHLRAHRDLDGPDVAVLGLTRWPDGAQLTATMRHIDGPGGQQFSYQGMRDGGEYDFRHFYTSNISLPRELIRDEQLGFDEGFPAAAFEDAEYAYRLCQRGMRIVYRASAVAFHHHHYGAAGFFARQVRCGAMAHLLYRKHPELRRWLSIRTVEWTRLEVARAHGRPRARLDSVASDLDLWERRALNLARFADHLRGPAPDDLLAPLFRYGFLRGLAGAVLPEGIARSVWAALFVGLVPDGVRRMLEKLARAGLAAPAADARAILALAPDPSLESHE